MSLFKTYLESSQKIKTTNLKSDKLLLNLYRNTKDNVAKVLVGNKLDMENNRRVMYSEGL